MPIIWAWEYGSRGNLSDVKERWFPLVKVRLAQLLSPRAARKFTDCGVLVCEG